MSRMVAAIIFAVLLPGCSEAHHAAATETAASHPAASTAVPEGTVHRAPTLAAAQSPFAHLAEAMSYDCIRSATDSHVARTIVYLRCIGARNALLNAKAPHPYADDNAVTASALEIYAAYALREASTNSTTQYHALLRDADSRLQVLTISASTAQTRERAVTARSCLIERDAGCLKQWASYQ